MGMAPESVPRSGGVAHARGLRTALAVLLLVLGAGDLTAIATVFLPRYLASRPLPPPASMTIPTTTAQPAVAVMVPTLDTAPATDVGTVEVARPAPALPVAVALAPKEAERPEPTEVARPARWPLLLFGQNTAWLSEESRATLDKLSDYLKQHASVEVVLEGHTDDQGEADVNNWLSRNRALRAKQRLVERGIDPAQIEVHNFGAARPLLPNRTPEARAKNRRVEITVRERIH
jgi:outer membrane protein OmpA-like peptidoglycan-associated protein